MALISLSEWAKKNGKNPDNARQKAIRKTIPAVKQGNIWMIDEAAPWNEIKATEVSVHVTERFIQVAALGRENIEPICAEDNLTQEQLVQKIVALIRKVTTNCCIRVNCDFDGDTLRILESSVRKEYPLGRVFYDDEPRMEGVTNCGMLDMGEYLYDGKIVHFFTNDYRDFANILFLHRYSYVNLTKDIKERKTGACLYRFPYKNRNMYVYIQQAEYVNYLFFTRSVPRDGDWSALARDCAKQSRESKMRQSQII